VAALALVAVTLRWTLVATRLCGRGVSALVYVAAALAATAAVLWLTRVPPRSRVVLELAGRLGIARSDLLRATAHEEPSGALVAAAVACAAGLPALLHAARLLGSGLTVPALVSLAFAAFAPPLVRRFDGPTKATAHSTSNVVAGVVAGIALTAATVTAGRLFFDLGTELARCVQRLDAETRLARAAESAELAGAIAKVRASLPLLLVSTLVQPFAEERIYRGLLLDVLARKYGRAYGLVAASLAFGVAHLGIYHVALYQTVLLGVGFGVAYLEGGLVAAVIVHAAWNALQLIG
jgi:membrane protease YdiL (CAAX protease family)